MGLFSKLRNAAKPKDTRIAKAVLTPAVSTMISDGEINAAEREQLINVCIFSPIFLPIGVEATAKLAGDLIQEIGKEGHVPVLQRAVNELSPALRETALCFAMRIALADGFLDDNEKAAISVTADLMEITDEKFQKILEVVAMMQRPETA